MSDSTTDDAGQNPGLQSRFPTAYTFLFLLIIFVAALTWIIPAGQYDREMNQEIGREIACKPGLAYRRLVPSNCEDLLFNDVIWVKQARKDHDVFSDLMRGEGVEVLDTGAMLAETRHPRSPQMGAGLSHHSERRWRGHAGRVAQLA